MPLTCSLRPNAPWPRRIYGKTSLNILNRLLSTWYRSHSLSNGWRHQRGEFPTGTVAWT